MASTKAAYWMQYITADDEILAGKPTIKGTRLSVDFLLERLASGWTEADILENYPRLRSALPLSEAEFRELKNFQN